MGGILLAIVGITVLFVIIFGVQTVMEPVDRAFGDVIERMVSSVEAALGDAPTLIVPFQIGAALLAVVSVIGILAASAAGFFLGLLGLVAAACLYDLSRRLSLRAELRPRRDLPRPASSLGVAPSSAARRSATAGQGIVPAASEVAATKSESQRTTYTSAPPTAEAVRKRVRLSELQHASRLSPSEEAELELLLSNEVEAAG